MGYKKGEGLGKNRQGRTQIVEASAQRGRRGLGLTIGGFEPSNIQWKFEDEEVSVAPNDGTTVFPFHILTPPHRMTVALQTCHDLLRGI